MPRMFFTSIRSPVGDLMLAGHDDALTRIDFHGGSHSHLPAAQWQQTSKPFADAISQLQSYFAGQRQHFDLPLQPHGTLFQRSAWNALQKIPYGATCTYADIAQAIGRPGAVRAVGAANARNPIPIIIPCHRVIGSDGRLTGFAGGLETRRQLLTLEGSLPQRAMCFVGEPPPGEHQRALFAKMGP